MRYHFDKPKIYLTLYGERYICEHPVYNTCDDIDGLIDDIFGTGVNPDPDEPTYSPDDIATEKELNDAITDVFG